MLNSAQKRVPIGNETHLSALLMQKRAEFALQSNLNAKMQGAIGQNMRTSPILPIIFQQPTTGSMRTEAS